MTRPGERPFHYPRSMRGWKNVPTDVPQHEWMSQPEAALRLDTKVFRIGLMIACENLDPVSSPSGEGGVTLASVEREIEWRSSATLSQKLRRGIRSTVRWF